MVNGARLLANGTAHHGGTCIATGPDRRERTTSDHEWDAHRFMGDGSVLISDDLNGAIYRVARQS